MILHDVTMRTYGRYQALLGQYDEAVFEILGAFDEDGEPLTEFAPLLRAGAMVRAARDAGIADALAPPLDKGDPLDLVPTPAIREALTSAAVEILQHIKAATTDNLGE